MTVSKSILKKARGQAVVKFLSVGGGEGNVSLAELTMSDETLTDQPNSTVTISGMYNSIDAMANISRNNSNVLILAAAQQDKWEFTQSWGFTLNEDANANIYVNFGGNGSIILVLNKTKGYNSTSRITHID
jgi:hypothetical protein